jgi:hypothetical protein
MKKLGILGIIGGAALLTAVPVSLQWSQKTVAISLDTAEARIGRPGTALSIAGVHRRAYRRTVRRAVVAGAVGYGVGAYGGYGYPAYSYSAPTAPYYGTGYGSYYGGYGYPAYSYGPYYGGYSTAPYNPGPSFGWRW